MTETYEVYSGSFVRKMLAAFVKVIRSVEDRCDACEANDGCIEYIIQGFNAYLEREGAHFRLVQFEGDNRLALMAIVYDYDGQTEVWWDHGE